MYDKHRSGAIAELKVAQFYLENDYEVFFPTTASKVDFIALKDNVTVRVQVKNAYYMERETGKYYIQVTTRRNFGKYVPKLYKKDDYDVLAVVYKEKLWLFPCSDVYHLQSIVLEKGQQDRRAGKNNFDASGYRVH